MHFFAPRSNHHWWSLDSETLRKGKMGLRAGIQKWITWKNFWLSFFLTKWILSMPSSFVFKFLSPFSSDWLDKLNFLLITRLTSGFYFFIYLQFIKFANIHERQLKMIIDHFDPSEQIRYTKMNYFKNFWGKLVYKLSNLINCRWTEYQKDALKSIFQLVNFLYKNSTNRESAIQPEVIWFS